MEPTKEVEQICENLIDKLHEEKIKYDAKKLKFAFDYALKIYKDTKRYKGETTFAHAVHVAEIVAAIKNRLEKVNALDCVK